MDAQSANLTLLQEQIFRELLRRILERVVWGGLSFFNAVLYNGIGTRYIASR
jgi:hypothetical protein